MAERVLVRRQQGETGVRQVWWGPEGDYRDGTEDGRERRDQKHRVGAGESGRGALSVPFPLKAAERAASEADTGHPGHEDTSSCLVEGGGKRERGRI